VSSPRGGCLADGLRCLRKADRDIERLTGGRFEEILALLNKYIEEIELFNPAYGLVGAGDRRELEIKHILDSLSPLGIMSRLLDAVPPEGSSRPRIADVGSGAGLPGIPLAIALPGISVTLIERSGRRAGFLRNTLAVLGSSNTALEETNMEQAAPGRFNLVTFRAFRPLEAPVLRGLFRLLAPGGILAAYKGRRETAEAEMRAVESLTGGWELLPLSVPFLEEERHLAVIRKTW
jgi:16S rRNA (guanine527-N7)-methyltransferase